jgi:hypothetical protein
MLGGHEDVVGELDDLRLAELRADMNECLGEAAQKGHGPIQGFLRATGHDRERLVLDPDWATADRTVERGNAALLKRSSDFHGDRCPGMLDWCRTRGP